MRPRHPRRSGAKLPAGSRIEAGMNHDLWALVLAGGDGTRLRPLTRLLAGSPIPKQYCRITGDRSLLEATLERLAPLVPPERTLVIVNRDHLPWAAAQLAGVPDENVVVQPRNRDTGPGLLLPLLHLARRAPQARVAVFPSDHYVAQPAAFARHVERARRLVDRRPRKIALLGIRPDRLDPGLGYIEPAAPLAPATFDVRAFREKPTPEEVARIVARGGLWNSFVMVFRLRRLLALLGAQRPADCQRMESVIDRPHALAAAYDHLAPWNFSRDFLAHIPAQLAVLRADDVTWSDWGTPEAIAHTLATLGQRPWWAPAAPLVAAGAR